MKAGFISNNQSRIQAAIIKKSGRIIPLGLFYSSTQASLEAAQEEIDRLKDAKKKKAKKNEDKHPLIFVNKDAIKNTYIVCVEKEGVVCTLDSSGDWVKWLKCKMYLYFSSYQEAYQEGLEYLKSLK